jgi:hypothetical protein
MALEQVKTTFVRGQQNTAQDRPLLNHDTEDCPPELLGS